ncbi:MAG: pyridoxamine kinase [Acidaminococcaceae bacterium]|nr:pyridoxamine kinase [Acidaminococcaceae bacterium]
MDYKRVLTIQDISCMGQCSLTVALPIISACGVETVILPSAVLSTHTAGFKGFTCRDLTEDIPAIVDHWQREGIRFDAFYTGYLGSAKQIDYVKDIFATLGRGDYLKIVDPAMADNGKLYPAFDQGYVEKMKELCAAADIVVPNITEACYMTGNEYRTVYDREYVRRLCIGLQTLGAKKVVLTGVSYASGRTGVMVADGDGETYYEHEFLPNSCHGTGDVYASVFVGALMRGRDIVSAARIAADFTVACIRYTAGDVEHWYGVKFEPLLGDLGKNF